MRRVAGRAFDPLLLQEMPLLSRAQARGFVPLRLLFQPSVLADALNSKKINA